MSAPVAVSGAGIGQGSVELLECCGGCGEWLRPEREPRLLPCLHSLCRGCLRPAPGGTGVECPVCRSECRLQDVVENYFLWECSAKPGDQGASQCCTSCEDNVAATSYCVECSEPLCGICMEAHQRVKYTKDHTVRPMGSGWAQAAERTIFCPVHKQELLVLFCDTCEALTCQNCQLSTHQDHQYQFMEEAVRSQKKLLLGLLKHLGDKQAALQRSACMRRVAEVQKQVQVEVKVAILQIMKELNKRGRVLVSDAQRVTEGQQEKLEQQHWAITKLQQQQEHILHFTSWALERNNSTALLLCRRLICLQLQGALKAMAEPVEPQRDMKFQWDSSTWTRSAESFASGPPEAAGTRRKRHCPMPSPLLRKVPRVHLELGLELGAAPVPVFRVLPGASAREFSLIIIERGQPHGPSTTIKEEQPEDMKPLLTHPNGPVGTGSSSEPGCIPGSMLGSVSCCRVCRRAGAVVMCDCCERCFHFTCHLPPLQEVPSPKWRCLLCQDLTPTSQDLTEGPPQKLCPLDQQKCELVLLQLLCHEPCQPLHHLSSSTDIPDPTDLMLIRARLQEKLSPHYRSPEEFAQDIWRLLRQFSSQSEEKEHVQSILALQSFVKSRLSAAFGDGKFSAAQFLMEPLVPMDEAQGSPAPSAAGAVGP